MYAIVSEFIINLPETGKLSAFSTVIVDVCVLFNVSSGTPNNSNLFNSSISKEIANFPLYLLGQ